jgi:hypothetical protein
MSSQQQIQTPSLLNQSLDINNIRQNMMQQTPNFQGNAQFAQMQQPHFAQNQISTPQFNQQQNLIQDQNFIPLDDTICIFGQQLSKKAVYLAGGIIFIIVAYFVWKWWTKNNKESNKKKKPDENLDENDENIYNIPPQGNPNNTNNTNNQDQLTPEQIQQLQQMQLQHQLQMQQQQMQLSQMQKGQNTQ